MARLGLRLQNGKYKVNEFVEEHNHGLHTVETSHMLASQCRIYEVQTYELELAEDSSIQQKTYFDLMCMHRVWGRENLGYTSVDVKNYLKIRRQRNMTYGDTGALF